MTVGKRENEPLWKQLLLTIITNPSLNSLTLGVMEKSLCWIDDEIVTTGIEMKWRNAMRLDWFKNILRLILNEWYDAQALFMLYVKKTIIYLFYRLFRCTLSLDAFVCLLLLCQHEFYPKSFLSVTQFPYKVRPAISTPKIMKIIIGMTLKNRKWCEL